MIDITKCKGEHCFLKNYCVRYTSPADELYQSYFTQSPIEGSSCDMFWGNSEFDKIIEPSKIMNTSEKVIYLLNVNLIKSKKSLAINLGLSRPTLDARLKNNDWKKLEVEFIKNLYYDKRKDSTKSKMVR